MNVDVSIIILNYNTCRLTMDCLRSVYDSETRYSYEIILIDNNSHDHSVETISKEFPDVLLIANSENVGFAKGNNQGMEVASGRYLLLLNSDTVVRKDTLETMAQFMDSRPDLGASGCKVILPDGSLDKACKEDFRHHLPPSIMRLASVSCSRIVQDSTAISWVIWTRMTLTR